MAFALIPFTVLDRGALSIIILLERGVLDLGWQQIIAKVMFFLILISDLRRGTI